MNEKERMGVAQSSFEPPFDRVKKRTLTAGTVAAAARHKYGSGGTACKDLVRSPQKRNDFATRRVVPCASEPLVGWLPAGAWRGRSAIPDVEKPPFRVS
jgi:hypothetical protein